MSNILSNKQRHELQYEIDSRRDQAANFKKALQNSTKEDQTHPKDYYVTESARMIKEADELQEFLDDNEWPFDTDSDRAVIEKLSEVVAAVRSMQAPTVTVNNTELIAKLDSVVTKLDDVVKAVKSIPVSTPSQDAAADKSKK